MSSNTWFTSDTHFGHANIVRYCNRPFANVREMDEALISNWNECVKPKDTIYHLGDFAFRGDPSPIFRRLNGEKFLLLGNHDVRKVVNKLFGWVKSTYKLRYNNQRIWLSHYAHLRWPNSHHGSFHLYGHSHGQLEGMGRSMDVGVDVWNYRPVHIDVVLGTLKGLDATEHH